MSFSAHYSWDFLSPDEIEQRTIRALRNHIAFLKESSPFYGEALSSINSNEITSLKQYAETVPLTDKEHFAEGGTPFYVASPSQIVETVVTSGVTGDPLPVPLTSADVDRITYNEALSFNNAGVVSDDRAFIFEQLDAPKISGMAHYRGLTLLGVNTMRVANLSLTQQVELFKAFAPTLLVGAPSGLLVFAKALAKEDGLLKNHPLKLLFCVDEPVRTAEMELTEEAQELESFLGAKVLSSYSSTEMATTFCDCEERSGGHIHPELLYAEIVDEEGSVVEDGEVGELVVTPLGIQGMPVARLRTGDMTFKVTGTCGCGRSSLRIGPILSRAAQQITIKGVQINLRLITNLLDSYSFLQDYLVELHRNQAGDDMHIHVAMPAQQVAAVMQDIVGATGVQIPVLVSNGATISGMRGEEPPHLKILDKRPQE